MRGIHPYPGVIDVVEGYGGFARLQWGPLAGILSWQDLSEWKRAVWLVVAEDLTPALCGRLGLRRPARVIADEQSITRAAVNAAPAYCVDEEIAAALGSAGCRLCRFGYHRGNAELIIETRGGDWGDRRLMSNLYDLYCADGRSARPDSDELIDRALRAVTDDVVGEAAVRAAVDISARIDDLLINSERRAQYIEERVNRESFTREHPDLVEEYGWMFAPDHAIFSVVARDEELEARRAAGESTRAAAESLVQSLTRGQPPPRVRIAGVGWIPITRTPAQRVFAAGEGDPKALLLPPSCWGLRRP